MYRYQDVVIRKFLFDDIPLKIKWVNDSINNKYLHYDLPLEYEKTCKWYANLTEKNDRFDGIIEFDGVPVGIIGLLDIDLKNRKAEEYIMLGNADSRGKGLAKKAGILNQIYGFNELGLNKIFAYTEVENISALSLYLKRGFKIEGVLKEDLIYNGRRVDRYLLGAWNDNFQIPEGVYWED